MTLHDRETNKLIADLIFGWYESLICPMEKTLHLSGENRATLIAKKSRYLISLQRFLLKTLMDLN